MVAFDLFAQGSWDNGIRVREDLWTWNLNLVSSLSFPASANRSGLALPSPLAVPLRPVDRMIKIVRDHTEAPLAIRGGRPLSEGMREGAGRVTFTHRRCLRQKPARIGRKTGAA
jgi:hypothetical protein